MVEGMECGDASPGGSNNEGPNLNFSYRFETNQDVNGRSNNFSTFKLIKSIMNGLTEQDQQALRTSCFGTIIDLSSRVDFSSQLVHFMLMKEVHTSKTQSMWFVLQNQLMRFGLSEFQRVTGLNCSKVDKIEQKDLDMFDVLGHKLCSFRHLERLYMVEDKNSKNKLKMAFVLFLEGILLGRDRKTRVRNHTVNLVHDIDKFNSYPWGRTIYFDTLSGLRKAIKLDRKSKGYNLYGFPLAFQIWVFEVAPQLANLFAVVDNRDAVPLCMKWISNTIGIKKGKMPTYSEIVKTAEKGLVDLKPTLCDDIEDEDVQDSRIDEFFERGCPHVYIVPCEKVNEDAPLTEIQVEGDSDGLRDEQELGCNFHRDKRTKVQDDVHVSKNETPVSKHPQYGVESRMQLTMSSHSHLPAWETILKDAFEEIKVALRDQGDMLEHIKHQLANLQATAERHEHKLSLNTTRLDRLHKLVLTSYGQTDKHGLNDCLPKDSCIPTTHNVEEDQTCHTQSSFDELLEQQVHEVTQGFTTTKEFTFAPKLHVRYICINDELSQDMVNPKMQEIRSPAVTLTYQQIRKGSRDRKPGPLTRMPFTPTYKRDVRVSKIPAQHSFLTDKERAEFHKWYKSKSKSMSSVVLLTNTFDKNEFFKCILPNTGWLHGEQIDELLCHLRKGLLEYPQYFQNVAILNTVWMARFNIGVFTAFSNAPSGTYQFHDDWFSLYRGEYPLEYGKPLHDVDKIYAPFNIENKHWVALEIDLLAWDIIIYDSNVGLYLDSDFETIFDSICIMMPESMRQYGGFERFGHNLQRPFKCGRRLDLPKNEASGSCGIYTIKYIEFLCRGIEDFHLICDDYVPAYREQLAFYMFKRQWSWPWINSLV